MPKISEKGNLMPSSPIRKLAPYAELAKAKGIKVFHLNIGQPDILTPKVALDAVSNHGLEVVEYSHSAGIESFRRALAAYYAELNIHVDYNDILITTGGSEALIFTFWSCFNPGDEIIIPEPFYTNYNGFTAETDVNIVPVTSSFSNGFALPDISEFEKQISIKTKGILISNPNNPTGYLYSLEELEKLKELVVKHDLYLISDEVYADFCYDGSRHHSVLQMHGMDEHTILIDSVSKRYSGCGLRIGALVTKNKKVIETALKFGQARLSPPTFGQIAAEAALSVDKKYRQEVYNEYLARRDYVIDALNKIEGVKAPMPKGAFYTIIELPVDDAEKFCQWMLEEFSYENQTVMLAPAAGFYCTKGLGKKEVRIAYVLNVEDLKKAVKCLEVALQQYPGRIE